MGTETTATLGGPVLHLEVLLIIRVETLGQNIPVEDDDMNDELMTEEQNMRYPNYDCRPRNRKIRATI